VHIAVDDFDTVFSPLGCATSRLVDRSLVQGIEHDAKGRGTANVVSLAHVLGLLAIAEGIESDGQLTCLRELGCDLAQGILLPRLRLTIAAT
jgi:EAL domain-containing protein (putative c-di-GMP-specific phosphodiesterase class I)